jgi:hypothetical protein
MLEQIDDDRSGLSQVLGAEFKALRPKQLDPKYAPPNPTADETENRKDLYNGTALAIAASGGASGGPSGSLSRNATTTEAISAMAGRTAGVVALRDGLYSACQAYANRVIGKDAYALILSQYGNLLVLLAGTTGHDAGDTSAASSTPTLPGVAVAVSTGTTPSSAKPCSTPGSSNAGAAGSSRERRVVRVA